jgi:hypothetical protein
MHDYELYFLQLKNNNGLNYFYKHVIFFNALLLKHQNKMFRLTLISKNNLYFCKKN